MTYNYNNALETADAALEQLGVPHFHAYPAGGLRKITVPTATLEIRAIDKGNLTTTIRVNVLSPIAMGAEACEREATGVCYVLSAAGADFRMGATEFLTDAEVFRTPIDAVFDGIA